MNIDWTDEIHWTSIGWEVQVPGTPIEIHLLDVLTS